MRIPLNKGHVRRKPLLLLLLIIPASLAAVGALTWRQPPDFPFNPEKTWKADFPEEATVAQIASEAKEPYIVHAQIGKGEITIVGVHHTRNPKDPSLAKVVKAWKDAKPAVAFVEGRPSGPLAAINPVAKFGEDGLVAKLARSDYVPTLTWHLRQEDIAPALLKRFKPRQVALFMIGSKYFADFRFGKPSDPDSVLTDLIGSHSDLTLKDEIKTVADYDRIWKQDFPGAKDWRYTSDQYGLPGYLEEIALYSRQIRDIHLINLALGRARDGERVFAICGMNHATRIKPMLDEIVRNNSWN